MPHTNDEELSILVYNDLYYLNNESLLAVLLYWKETLTQHRAGVRPAPAIGQTGSKIACESYRPLLLGMRGRVYVLRQWRSARLS